MAKVTATLRPAVAVQNAERSRTSFYMSKVSLWTSYKDDK
ncbi:hypothetical protein NP493_1460g00005 [Ridgeia piscesae]|uniref:Uncharacterized protein n=1 Tax=Ridgeia piscesae TaxID=27915 RepID=A0AAD9NCG2_RIDPI|nr:hypothetical protein NP493_1460g00005 [Ridgeia piscesae]